MLERGLFGTIREVMREKNDFDDAARILTEGPTATDRQEYIKSQYFSYMFAYKEFMTGQAVMDKVNEIANMTEEHVNQQLVDRSKAIARARLAELAH